MTRRSGKVYDTTPTWAPFSGWSVLLAHDDGRIGLGPNATSCRAFASQIDRLTDRFGAAAVDFARLPTDSLHITLCDGVNVRMRELDEPRIRDPRTSVEVVGTEIFDVLAAVARPIEWIADGLEIRGHAVVVAVLTDEDLADLRDQRRRLLERLGAAAGIDLDTRWRPHMTIGYLIDDDRLEQRRLDAERIWAAEPPSRESTLTTHSARVFEFDDMATFRPVDMSNV